jgi:hypothetical protein
VASSQDSVAASSFTNKKWARGPLFLKRKRVYHPLRQEERTGCGILVGRTVANTQQTVTILWLSVDFEVIVSVL